MEDRLAGQTDWQRATASSFARDRRGGPNQIKLNSSRFLLYLRNLYFMHNFMTSISAFFLLSILYSFFSFFSLTFFPFFLFIFFTMISEYPVFPRTTFRLHQ